MADADAGHMAKVYGGFQHMFEESKDDPEINSPPQFGQEKGTSQSE